METNISSWFYLNDYFKGNLDDLQIWNKGDISYRQTEVIDLFDSKGNFFKKERLEKYTHKEDDVRICNVQRSRKEIIQIDYDFFLVPISERLEIIDGRNRLIYMLKNYGINGFCNRYNDIDQEHHYTFKRSKFIVERPMEITFCWVKRWNAKSFMEFNYNKYIENYKRALIKFPQWEKDITSLKERNIMVLCDFYEIEEHILQRENFDRLKYAIRKLNKKITNRIKNKQL